MKVWYKAVCDEHKCMCDVMVDGPWRTKFYLGNRNDEIYEWQMKHYGCKLRLIADDIGLDECYDKGYVDDSKSWKPKTDKFSLERVEKWGIFVDYRKKSMEDAGKSLKDYKPHQLSALIGLAFFRYDVELNKMELYLDDEFHEVSGVQEFAALCDIFNKKGNLPDFFN